MEPTMNLAEGLPPSWSPDAALGAASGQEGAGLWIDDASVRLGLFGMRKALAIIDDAAKNAELSHALADAHLGELLGEGLLRSQIEGEVAELLAQLQQPPPPRRGAPAQTWTEEQSGAPCWSMPGQVAIEHGQPQCWQPPPWQPPAWEPPPWQPPAWEPPPWQPPAWQPPAWQQPPWQPPAWEPQKPGLQSMMGVLAHEDRDCVFVVRGTNKLGFRAESELLRHFSAFGVVLRVLVAPSKYKKGGVRPGSMGYVQMASAAAVEAVFATGAVHEVSGVALRIEKFGVQHPQADDETASSFDCGSSSAGTDTFSVGFGPCPSECSSATRASTVVNSDRG